MRSVPRSLYVAIIALALGIVALTLMGPTGGLPARPRFQSVGIGTPPPAGLGGLSATGNASIEGTAEVFGTLTAFGNPSIVVSSTTNPEVEWNNFDTAADHGRWHIIADPTMLRMRALNDAGSTVNSFLEVARTGAVIDSINLMATDVLVNGSPIAGGGGPIVSETAYDATGLAVGETVIISKAADDTIASDIDFTLDDDLQVTNLPTGHYQVRLSLVFTSVGGGSRAATSDASVMLTGTHVCAGGAPAAALVNSVGGVPCSSTPAWVTASGSSAKAFAGGTIGVLWRQNLSDVGGTTLESDSWLEVTRID